MPQASCEATLQNQCIFTTKDVLCHKNEFHLNKTEYIQHEHNINLILVREQRAQHTEHIKCMKHIIPWRGLLLPPALTAALSFQQGALCVAQLGICVQVHKAEERKVLCICRTMEHSDLCICIYVCIIFNVLYFCIFFVFDWNSSRSGFLV